MRDDGLVILHGALFFGKKRIALLELQGKPAELGEGVPPIVPAASRVLLECFYVGAHIFQAVRHPSDGHGCFRRNCSMDNTRREIEGLARADCRLIDITKPWYGFARVFSSNVVPGIDILIIWIAQSPRLSAR